MTRSVLIHKVPIPVGSARATSGTSFTLSVSQGSCHQSESSRFIIPEFPSHSHAGVLRNHCNQAKEMHVGGKTFPFLQQSETRLFTQICPYLQGNPVSHWSPVKHTKCFLPRRGLRGVQCIWHDRSTIWMVHIKSMYSGGDGE